MADEVDRAQEREERDRLDALSRARPAGNEAPIGVDGACIDCGEEIPAERRKAVKNAQRCIDCQTWFEGFRGQK